ASCLLARRRVCFVCCFCGGLGLFHIVCPDCFGRSRLLCGMWRSAARTIPLRMSNNVDAVARSVSHNDAKAGQPALRRARVPFFRQGSVFASRGVPSTIPTE
ncbi:hypothetical protein TcCL_Unassigned05283, partial [Trypanosoma cruzi]